jgi:hypothetical protein
LRAVVPPDRAPAIDDQLQRLEAAVKEAAANERDAALMSTQDRSGIGG